MPLTDAGRRDAEALLPLLSEWVFAAVRSSPLARALDTATLAGLGGAVEVDPDLCEWDYGDMEGRTTEEIRRDSPDWSVWRAGPTGGESVADVGRRVDRVLARVRPVLDGGGDVALVAHGHLLRILTARWLELPPVDGRLFALDPATICVLDHERQQPVIRRWNVGRSR